MNFLVFEGRGWVFFVILAAILVAVAWATLGMKAWFERRAFRRLMQRAYSLEKKALRFLEERGFQCLGEQVERDSFFVCDGQKIPFRVRVDYLLERGGRRYVAEVKTGKQVEDFEKPAVRRQLLEYALLFAPWPILFIDGENQRIHEVSFPWIWSSSRVRIWMWVLFFLVGFIVGRWSRCL